METDISCQQCKQKTIAKVNGKVSDMFDFTTATFSYSGYVLKEFNIGHGDYIKFSFCFSCGQIQGNFPMDLSQFQQNDD